MRRWRPGLARPKRVHNFARPSTPRANVVFSPVGQVCRKHRMAKDVPTFNASHKPRLFRALSNGCSGRRHLLTNAWDKVACATNCLLHSTSTIWPWAHHHRPASHAAQPALRPLLRDRRRCLRRGAAAWQMLGIWVTAGGPLRGG